jgi:hypothetical protein
MTRLQNVWRPLLLGAVLMAILVGVVGAVPTEKPSALSTQRQLVIGAGDFYPTDNDAQYFDGGLYLNTTADSTYTEFVAPVDFLAPFWVTVDKLELFALDNNNGGYISASLYLSKPSKGTEQMMASVDTGWDFADPTEPRTWSTTAISPNIKNPANDTYVYLQISDDTDLVVYGVRIWYRVGK